MTREAIDRDVLAWMAEPWDDSEARFNELALRVFRHQFAHCAPYRAFCESRGARPDALAAWTDIPCVPTGAFKSAPLCSFDEKELMRFIMNSINNTCRIFLKSYLRLNQHQFTGIGTKSQR